MVKSLAPLLSRLVLGVVFAESGWGKLHSLDRVTSFFTSLAIPFPAANAYVVSGLELACGVLLLVGLATRLAALPLIPIMAVAILTAKRSEIESLSALFSLPEFLFIVLSIWLVIDGGGKFGVDRLLAARGSKFFRKID